jgi:hypothetical protein
MRTAAVEAVVTAALLVAVAACGGGGTATVVPLGPTTLTQSPVCPQRGASAGAPVPIQDMPIAAVVVCDLGDRDTSPYVERRYTTGIDAAVAGLGGQDEAAAGEVFCSGSEEIHPQVLVVAPDGRALVPRIPLDACGRSTDAVDALWLLVEQDPDSAVVVEAGDPAREAAERAAAADIASCPSSLPDVLAVVRASDARVPAPALPDLVVRGCTMEPDIDVGSPALRFMLGGNGSITDQSRLRRGLDAVDPAGTCPSAEPRGIITAYLIAGEALFYVEAHDGCGEVWTPEGFVGVLHGADIQALS